MLVIVDRSGRVPWESHRSEPIIWRNLVLSACFCSGGGGFPLTASTGYPDLYGVVAGLHVSVRPARSSRWSTYALWDMCTLRWSCLLVEYGCHWNL